jgi:hypothetical protein
LNSTKIGSKAELSFEFNQDRLPFPLAPWGERAGVRGESH